MPSNVRAAALALYRAAVVAALVALFFRVGAVLDAASRPRLHVGGLATRIDEIKSSLEDLRSDVQDLEQAAANSVTGEAVDQCLNSLVNQMAADYPRGR